MNRRAAAVAAAGAALLVLLSGCLPSKGTVTGKSSEFQHGKWKYYVYVDGQRYDATPEEYNTCDEGDTVVKGDCK